MPSIVKSRVISKGLISNRSPSTVSYGFYKFSFFSFFLFFWCRLVKRGFKGIENNLWKDKAEFKRNFIGCLHDKATALAALKTLLVGWH